MFLQSTSGKCFVIGLVNLQALGNTNWDLTFGVSQHSSLPIAVMTLE